ncbi:cyanophycin synthetase, partial [Staphylococcus aureus]|uniref:glutamate ligase domain-containing protein n=1 Tax=Staphylococcus aureus TaxID=1280 RepID=UPI001E54C8E6
EKAVKEKQQQIDNSLDSTDNEKEVASQALAKEKEKALAFDYAHTADGMNKLIDAVQPFVKQKLIFLVGMA